MLYKKAPSNRTVCNTFNTINKLTQYTQKISLSKHTPISSSKSIFDSISFNVSTTASRNNNKTLLKSSYTTTANEANSNLSKVLFSNRKNEHILDKISSVLNEIKKSQPYYSITSTHTSKRQSIENIKNKIRRRPKSKEFKLLEMKVMLNHPLNMATYDSNEITSTINQNSNKYTIKTQSSIHNHKRVLSESNQRDVDEYSKQFNTNSSLIPNKTKSKIMSRNGNNYNINSLRRTLSCFNEMIQIAKPMILSSPHHHKGLSSYK